MSSHTSDATATIRKAVKREMIDEDPSDSGQSAAKKIKMEPPSAEFVKVQQLLGKMETKFKKAVIYAGQYRKRAEDAEKARDNLLDTKVGVKESLVKNERVEELEKKYSEVSSQLVEAKKSLDTKGERVQELEKKNSEITSQLADANGKAEKANGTIAVLSAELETERKSSERTAKEYKLRADHDEKKLDKAEERAKAEISAIVSQLEEANARAEQATAASSKLSSQLEQSKGSEKHAIAVMNALWAKNDELMADNAEMRKRMEEMAAEKSQMQLKLELQAQNLQQLQQSLQHQKPQTLKWEQLHHMQQPLLQQLSVEEKPVERESSPMIDDHSPSDHQEEESLMMKDDEDSLSVSDTVSKMSAMETDEKEEEKKEKKEEEEEKEEEKKAKNEKMDVGRKEEEKKNEKKEEEEEKEDEDEENDDEEHAVEKIEDHEWREGEKGGVLFYKVKWEGYEEQTWEPERYVESAKELVDEYRKRLPVPFRLKLEEQEWKEKRRKKDERKEKKRKTILTSDDEREEEKQKEEKKKEEKQKEEKEKEEKEKDKIRNDAFLDRKEVWLVSCICGAPRTVDDGEGMVGCDKCVLRWEHIECIFPRTKEAPEGQYFCHHCKPRPTELTPDQARALQKRIKEQKEQGEVKEKKKKKKMEEEKSPAIRKEMKTHAIQLRGTLESIPPSTASVSNAVPELPDVPVNPDLPSKKSGTSSEECRTPTVLSPPSIRATTAPGAAGQSGAHRTPGPARPTPSISSTAQVPNATTPSLPRPSMGAATKERSVSIGASTPRAEKKLDKATAAGSAGPSGLPRTPAPSQPAGSTSSTTPSTRSQSSKPSKGLSMEEYRKRRKDTVAGGEKKDESVKRKEAEKENSRPPSVARSTHSRRSVSKDKSVPSTSSRAVSRENSVPSNSMRAPSNEKSVPVVSTPASKNEKKVPSEYLEIEKNEYSADARKFLNESRQSDGKDAEIVKILREKPRVGIQPVEATFYGGRSSQYAKPPKMTSLVAKEDIASGEYITELCGHVSMQRECPNRDVVPGSLNDHTFLIEKSEEKMIVDARKCGNLARFVRRSCKPNAELEEIMYGSDLHVMIKAKSSINSNEEVTIDWESDWRDHPKPAQPCVCKRDVHNPCTHTLYFHQKRSVDSQRRASSSIRTLPVSSPAPTREGSVTDVKPETTAQTVSKSQGPMTTGKPSILAQVTRKTPGSRPQSNKEPEIITLD